MTNPEFLEHVQQMKAMGKLLIPFTYPLVSRKDDLAVMPLRCRQMRLDGYDLHILFISSVYEDYCVQTVQIRGVYAPFLPMNLICKVGRAFLGDRRLCYIDFIMEDSRKMYHWSIKSKKMNGKPMPWPKRYEKRAYEGFEFHCMREGPIPLS
jgi:hypothetical protein